MTSPGRFIIVFCLPLFVGCYAPLHSPGTPACELPDSFRFPVRAMSTQLNYAMLAMQPPRQYVLGPGDVIRVDVSDLIPQTERRTPSDLLYSTDVRIAADGKVLLPLVGSVSVDGMTFAEAQQAIRDGYADGYIDDPQVALSLVERSVTSVIVLGAVANPDVYELPKYENDVAHAIARAGGLTEDAGNLIEVHRKSPRLVEQANSVPTPSGGHTIGQDDSPSLDPLTDSLMAIEPQTLRIPLRAAAPLLLSSEEVTLGQGDVVMVPHQTAEVFFVVGKLSPNNLVRFTLGRENRDLGNGFVLPPDRDVDVVTAVAMAGYIDPIDSPTTVTVHRTQYHGEPMLIHVDLIAARYDRRENVMVQAGDIIYLNPDGPWWFRRTLDRVIPTLITSPYTEAMEALINPGGTR